MTRAALILIDGLRPDAITPQHAPYLTQLLDSARYTLTASSVSPSQTLPCHLSIVHSLPPQLHGVTENHPDESARPTAGLFEHLKARQKLSAFLYNYGPLRCLARAGSLHYEWAYDIAERDLGADALLAQVALQSLPRGRFDFSFIYLGTLDIAGHLYGWMSEGYLRHLQTVDALAGRLIEALPDHALMVLSDHGGHDRLHGTELPEDMTIPLILRAEGIEAGRIEGPASLLDVAPTICALLHLPPAEGWQGRSLI